MGWRVHVTGAHQLEAAAPGPRVIVSNHTFYLDSALIGAVVERGGLPPPTLLASTVMGGTAPFELLKRLGLVGQCVYTRSTESTAAERVATREALGAWRDEAASPLVVFPEGQVHNCDTFLMRYEKFCFGLDLPVVPVALRIQPFWSVQLWIAGEFFPWTWALVLMMPWTTWQFDVLAPLCRQRDERAEDFARRVQVQTAEHLRVQATDLTLREVVGELEQLTSTAREQGHR